jgi:asparagine synthase (glutamine-hydrolysing)
MFAGLLSIGSHVPADFVEPADLLAALSPHYPPDATGVVAEGDFLLVQAMQRMGPRHHESVPGTPLPYRCPQSGRIVAFWGRLDERETLNRILGRSTPLASNEELVLAAFDCWGAQCAEKLAGDFAGAILDPTTRRVFLFRDRLGVKPLYYRLDGEALIFATTAAVFPHLRRNVPTHNPTWIASHLVGVIHDPTATGFAGVVKLAPGHWLDFQRGAMQVEKYHSWRNDAPWTTERDPSWVTSYRTVLEETIRCRMPDDEPIGTESSGGLDSSTISAYLAHFLGTPGDRLWTFGFAGMDLEAEFIIETSRHAGIVHNYLVTGSHDRGDSDIARGLDAVGYPDACGNPVGHIRFYEECKRLGIHTLFSGFGGDESVTNSGTLLGRELLDRRAYEALWRYVQGGVTTRALRVARARARTPRWGAGHPQLVAAMEARWPYHLVRSEIVQRLGLYEEYKTQAAFDAPYRRINDFILHNRLGSSIARRLEGCTLVAATYGVEYQWPLLDARLVQQYLSTPSIEKADHSAGRYLHRRAAEGILPAKVVWKPTKDMGGPPSAMDQSVAGDNAIGAGLVERARRQEAHLHPAIEEIIDVQRFRAQIDAAVNGRLSADGGFQFARNVGNLGWLNYWLTGGPLPG